MLAHAVETAPDDVDGMIAALEGWKFDGPKGAMEIRAEDHALLQPMFQAKLVSANGTLTPELISTVDPADTAPPATPFK